MRKFNLLSLLLFLCSVSLPAQELSNFMNSTPIVSPEFSDGEVTLRIKAPKAREVKLYGSWMANYTDTQPLAEKQARSFGEERINAYVPCYRGRPYLVELERLPEYIGPHAV
ncbi:hypothetical protein [Proteiniphilum sp. X52]|uniref:hypothetical protein n=1 Tax=Proteiniphilum sp. X52 TaxID=2382159 RepID=UPI000F0A5632|nr:hypothetical protein [Proteiniphilum sp. X52]RNC66427.1 hypothetical protein D7D25_02820 [Proteiniphilum sp. X52]